MRPKIRFTNFRGKPTYFNVMTCLCPCHTSAAFLHFMPCCDDGYINGWEIINPLESFPKEEGILFDLPEGFDLVKGIRLRNSKSNEWTKDVLKIVSI